MRDMVEIGMGRTARCTYELSDINIVPSRRTRSSQDVSTAWQLDAYRFEMPLVVPPMDSVVSPQTAITVGRLGGLAVLDLEGLWTRYGDPEPLLAEVGELPEEEQRTVVVAIVQRELGVMVIAALVIVVLLARAAGTA